MIANYTNHAANEQGSPAPSHCLRLRSRSPRWLSVSISRRF